MGTDFGPAGAESIDGITRNTCGRQSYPHGRNESPASTFAKSIIYGILMPFFLSKQSFTHTNNRREAKLLSFDFNMLPLRILFLYLHSCFSILCIERKFVFSKEERGILHDSIVNEGFKKVFSEDSCSAQQVSEPSMDDDVATQEFLAIKDIDF